jgi:lipid A 3-O-deacylase
MFLGIGRTVFGAAVAPLFGSGLLSSCNPALAGRRVGCRFSGGSACCARDGMKFASLGCNPLFHAGGSVGFVPLPRWSIVATFEHLSNGNSLFGINCGKNQGLNNYGVKIGYSF